MMGVDFKGTARCDASPQDCHDIDGQQLLTTYIMKSTSAMTHRAHPQTTFKSTGERHECSEPTLS